MAEPHLVAYVINVPSNPEVEYDVAYLDHQGNWRNNDGHQHWPFWTQPLPPEPPIPEGWIDYLFSIPVTEAKAEPKPSLLGLLGIKTTPKPTITRRI